MPEEMKGKPKKSGKSNPKCKFGHLERKRKITEERAKWIKNKTIVTLTLEKETPLLDQLLSTKEET